MKSSQQAAGKNRKKGKASLLILVVLLVLLFGLLVLRVLKDAPQATPSEQPTEAPPAAEQASAEPDPVQQTVPPKADGVELPDIEIELSDDAFEESEEMPTALPGGENSTPTVPAASSGSGGANELPDVPFILYD